MSLIIHKMNVVHVILLLVTVCCVRNVSGVDERRVKALTKTNRRHMRIRCTRRFAVGNCVEAVVPVWTFVAPLQACTERLGCPAQPYTNRFNSFEDCVSVCRELVHLFMYLLSSQQNDTFRVPPEGPESGSRSPADVTAWYSEFSVHHEDSSGDEEEDDEPPNIDHDFRRELNAAVSAVSNPLFAPDWEPDYPDEDQTSEEPDDNRPPLPSRDELMPESDLIVPDIDKFP